MTNDRGLGSKIGFALLGIFLTLLAFFLFAVGAFAMGTKGNVVLYLDRKLAKKSKELGFNLSKTFEIT